MDEHTKYTIGVLGFQAQFLTDLEKLRIGNGNRIWALGDRFGITEGAEVDSALQVDVGLKSLEERVEKDLIRALRATPFWDTIKSMIGVGPKQGARLLATIGHPRWRWDPETETWLPRTIGQLWSYCGYAPVIVGGQRTSDTQKRRAVNNGDSNGHGTSGPQSLSAVRVAAKRQRGEQSAYNTEARTRAFLVAESCIKQRHSPYRAVYDDGRAKYADAVHNAPCVRCGPRGKPAQVGSPLSDGHKHARALRLVAKRVLKDLWLAAGDHVPDETQTSFVPAAA